MRLAVALLALLAVAGCAGPGDDVPETTITVAEADARLEHHIRQVAAALPTHRLEPLGRPLTTLCGGVLGGVEDGRVTASRSYWLRDLPVEQGEATLDAAVAYWTAHGYEVFTRSRHQGIVSALAPDGTTGLSMQRNDNTGDVTIGADSLCVWGSQ